MQYRPGVAARPPFLFADEPDGLTAEERRLLLGGKGASLAEMGGVLGLPVPPAFTLTTDVCRRVLDGGWPADLDDHLRRALDGLERRAGRRLGDPSDPLLVSVRSGAPDTMPGMMDTVLNLGLDDAATAGLADLTDERFALDTHRRFLQSYAAVVLDAPVDLHAVVRGALEAAGVEREADLGPADLRSLIADLRVAIAAAGAPGVPDDPFEQLRAAVAAVFASWNGERATVYRAHEGIADVAVIGVPDERWGEVGKALVILVPDVELTPDEILAYAREQLAGFKVPKTVDFVEAIPRNPSGKILKRELRDPYWEGHERKVH